MPCKNANLHQAKRLKNDEFYTQMQTIEDECKHYVNHFNNQHIYLPCDDEKSNFWKHFVQHFDDYKLKHLTATHINFDGPSYRLDFDGKNTTKTPLEDNGDFRSPECTAIRDEADLVCTNPPFSLWRDFFFWLQGGNFKITEDGKYERLQ